MAFQLNSYTYKNHTLSLGLALFALSLLTVNIKITPEIFFSADYIVALSLIILVAGFIFKQASSSSNKLSPILPIVILFILCFTKTVEKPYGLTELSAVRGEIIFLAVLAFTLNKYYGLLWTPLLIFSSILFWYLFDDLSAGRVLSSDDHSTFLYRLEMLKEHFPFIPFYNPLWNAGIDERFFFATGALNIFFILSPIIYFIDLWEHYNLVPKFITFILLPASLYASALLLKYNHRTASLAGILGLTSSIAWYKWAYNFGPLGFLTTTALTPFLFSLALRLLNLKHQTTLFEAIATTLIASLVLLWSPGGLFFLPVIIVALFRIRSLLKKRYFKRITFALVCINLPWILIFWSASNVGNFLTKQSDVKKLTIEKPVAIYQSENNNDLVRMPTHPVFSHLHKSINLIQKYFYGSNLLIILLALPALFCLPKEHRVMFTLMAFWLVILGAFIAPFNPHIELDRSLVVLTIFLSIPTAYYIIDFIDSPSIIASRLFAALCLSFTIIYILSVGSIFRERSYIPLNFRSSLPTNLLNAINQHAKEGRALFAGFILHEVDNGHIAPFSLKTSVPIIASSPVHQFWRYRDVTPHEYLAQGFSGFEKYLDLMNAEIVVAHERSWKKLLSQHPDRYNLVYQEKSFSVFKRTNFQSNYFTSGNGKILEQTSSQVKLILSDSTAEIKFAYFPFLRSSDCDLGSFQPSNSLTFIKLTNCPINKPIIIDSKPPYARIKF